MYILGQKLIIIYLIILDNVYIKKPVRQVHTERPRGCVISCKSSEGVDHVPWLQGGRTEDVQAGVRSVLVHV